MRPEQRHPGSDERSTVGVKCWRCPLFRDCTGSYTEHLDRLVALLAPRVPDLVVLHGEMRPAARRAAADLLTRSADGADGQVVVATGRYVGEGFDYPRLDALLLAMPVAWKGTVVQYAGRLHRSHAGKSRAVVYDYVDAEVPVLRRMFAKRLRAYRTLGYELAESA